MMTSNHEQLILLLRCMGLGMWLGVLWEWIQLIRRAAVAGKHRRIAAFAVDFIGTLLSGGVVFLFALAANNGELRAVMLIAIAVGMATEHRTIGRLIRVFTPYICRFWKHISHFWEQLCNNFFTLAKVVRKKPKKVGFFYKKHLQE